MRLCWTGRCDPTGCRSSAHEHHNGAPALWGLP